MLVSGTIEEVKRALDMKAQVEIHFLKTEVDPLAVLNGLDDVGELRRAGDRITLAYDGEDETRARILASLIHAGVRVTEFVEKSRDLEEIFLQVGATHVQ